MSTKAITESYRKTWAESLATTHAKVQVITRVRVLGRRIIKQGVFYAYCIVTLLLYNAYFPLGL